MDTILVVNSGSSSLKFQVFEIAGPATLKRLVKGQLDGIGTQPQRLAWLGALLDPAANAVTGRRYPVGRAGSGSMSSRRTRSR
jgi:acetate kinase